MRKVLIAYATAGEGHKRAAIAIKDAFDQIRPQDTEVNIADTLDYTNAFFKWSYPRLYIFMVTYIPTIWGFLYYLSDFKWLHPLVRFLRRTGNGSNAKALEDYLLEHKPSVVISTHFLACEVIANLKKEGRLDTKLITCVTDFRMHSFWFAPETDAFLVGFEETKQDLVKKWGFPAQKISVVGIPVNPKFYAAKDKNEIQNRINIPKDMFTVLVTGGGFGVGPIIKIVDALLKSEKPLQILVVCGHNEALRKQIDSQAAARKPQSAAVKTFGFIDYVDELMVVSDIAVTKAGGLICSEAISKGLPLIIIAPIPGQESRNCRLMLENRAAFSIGRPCQAGKIIKRIQADTGVLAEMKNNIRRIRRENPAFETARFALTI